MGPPCVGVQELLFQRVLFEDPHVGLPHLPLQDPALPSNPPKAAGAPLLHHQLQTEVGAAPPSPVLDSWEQSERDTGAQSSCRQGVTWQLCILVGAPWS